ncbi:hypothetical protein P2N75_02915 [Escherichia coli]|nr:hypothetical protein [Shigella dysenteriae]MDI0506544.1 hypothetical protein [Escherichia coli]MDY3838233.1 hypothetical protein [Escherichia coli]
MQGNFSVQNGLNSKTTQNSEKSSNGTACEAFTSESRITLFKGKNALFDAQNHAKPDTARLTAVFICLITVFWRQKKNTEKHVQPAPHKRYSEMSTSEHAKITKKRHKTHVFSDSEHQIYA